MAIYLIAVFTCLSLTFDFKGSVDMDWLKGLLILTLPWSVVSFIFLWAISHGAGLIFFAFMYLAFAWLNCMAFYIFCCLTDSRRKAA